MTRYELKDWMAYIENRVSEEQQSLMETELLQSEAALALYLEAFELGREHLPNLDNASFTDEVMSQLREGHETSRKAPKPMSWTQQPIFHYTIAASITLILFTSGMFDYVTQALSGNEPSTGSFTETILHHATSWLDALKP